MKKANRKLKLKKTGIFYLIIIFFLLGITFFYTHKLYCWYQDNKKVKYIEEVIISNIEIKTTPDNSDTEIVAPAPLDSSNDYFKYIEMPFISVDFTELQKINPDTVGFISVSGTNINYPIVYSGDNKYYLNHDFQKNSNSAGWVFLDYRNNLDDLGTNNILYGHGRINKTVFGSLNNLLQPNWQENTDNYIIRLSTPNKNYLFQIFSIYEMDNETYYLKTKFNNETEIENWLDIMQARSIINTDCKLNTDDKILTLSTCTNTTTGRLVVQAKLLKVSNRNT